MSAREPAEDRQDRPLAAEKVEYLLGETVSAVIVLVEPIERLRVGLFEMTGRVSRSAGL